ncbi:MAG TPA: DMT family transporter [Jatrophihabitans sp.]|nr:DMT family transporter [Jatrophihabitans sp.]
MSRLAVVVLLSLAAALAFAVSTNLKHGSATAGPPAPAPRIRAIAGFAVATVRHPLWLAGGLTDLIGLGLQVTALHFGAISVVQPLLASGLLFTLVIRALKHRRIRAVELRWAAVLGVSLAGFLLVVGAAPGARPGEGVDRLPAAVAAAVGLVVSVAVVAVAHRVGPAVTRAALLGVVVGIVYAADAALLKTATDRLASGLLVLLGSWQLYAVILLGALGLYLSQLAYQAGPLTASQPAISVVDPLLSVVIGVLIFDERVRRGPVTGVLLVVLVAVLALSILKLARPEAEDVAAPPGVVVRH